MPVLPHETPVFSLDKCKIYPLTADPAGGTATYGAGIACTGIQSLAVDPDTLYKELFGDNAIIAAAGKARKFTFKLGMAKVSLDVMAQLYGGTVTDAGSTPAQSTTYSVKNTDAGKYFKLECQILGVEIPASSGGGDLHVVGWKCKVMSAAIAGKAEDFAPLTFDVAALARSADGKMFDLVENETLVALA